MRRQNDIKRRWRDSRIWVEYPDSYTPNEVIDGPGQLAYDRPERPSVRCISGPDSVEDEDLASDWIPPDLAARGFVPRWAPPDLEDTDE